MGSGSFGVVFQVRYSNSYISPYGKVFLISICLKFDIPFSGKMLGNRRNSCYKEGFAG